MSSVAEADADCDSCGSAEGESVRGKGKGSAVDAVQEKVCLAVAAAVYVAAAREMNVGAQHRSM